MRYQSTRGVAPETDFESVLTAGLAPDGGLYVPSVWPSLSHAEIDRFKDASYAAVAADVLKTFTGDAFSKARLQEITANVYGGFDHPDVAPLVRVGEDDYILELFHGPTLAFKDFAMQLLGALFDDVLARRGNTLTIIAATSGDTGAAAIHALAALDHVNVVVLHPEGRVTDVQRRMMTSVDAANVMNIAVAGDFDDCQAIVKQLFADRAFADRVRLSGVNSINWARLAAQTVYYFTAAAAVGGEGPVHFVVPTGNFGDVFAGYVAKKMGLDVGMLGVATNENDILHRALTTGEYSPADVTPTLSPSMDIQVASNFERLLFDALGRDADATKTMMERFAATKAMTLPEPVRAAMAGDFVSFAAGEDATRAKMKSHLEATGALIDPHTAVARVAAQRLRADEVLNGPTVTLSTAHPAKFPDAVRKATGEEASLPARWAGLLDRPEIMERAPADPKKIKSAIAGRFAG